MKSPYSWFLGLCGVTLLVVGYICGIWTSCQKHPFADADRSLVVDRALLKDEYDRHLQGAGGASSASKNLLIASTERMDVVFWREKISSGYDEPQAILIMERREDGAGAIAYGVCELSEWYQ